MKIKVVVTLKNGVLDPQGKAIQQTLNGRGYSNVQGVRQGKFFDLEILETHSNFGKMSQNCSRSILHI